MKLFLRQLYNLFKKIKKKEMLNLILFGPPGSGKGTQAAKLVEKYDLLHISTGDLFRYEIGNKTPLGIKAKKFMSKGQLVPDEVTIGMLNNKVEANLDVKGFIFDGFPRTIAQAEALDVLLKEKGLSISALISLSVEDDEIVSRILKRGESSGRSDDSDESVIRERIDVYNRQTQPVFDYYRKQNKSTQLSGIGSIDEIYDRLCASIDKIMMKKD